MLLTGSGDEFCGPLPAVGPSAFPVFAYWKFAWRSAPCYSPLLWCDFSVQPPLLCAVFFFFAGDGQSAQGAMLIYPRDGWGNTSWCLVLTCFVCWMSPKQVWSQHLMVVRDILFSQCNVTWRSFPLARGSGCQSFDSPWCFISAKCGPSVTARFLILRAHTLCFCTLVAILDPSYGRYFVEYFVLHPFVLCLFLGRSFISNT
jgi:hypothetical protein